MSRAAEARAPVVLITGASRGLGRELACAFAATGAEVLAAMRQPRPLADAASLPGTVRPLPLDVADPASIAALARSLVGRPIDILVNNAASRGATGGLPAVTPDDFMAVMAADVLGPLLMVQALRENLAAALHPRVVNISSRAGSMAEGADPDGDYAYRCAKAALNRATVKLAEDQPGLTVVSVHPGWLRTDMGGPEAELAVAPAAARL